jgi:hypothetical protein
MRTLAANLNFSTDTFNTAFTNINHLLWSLANEVVTANSTQGSTTGNAALVGTFTSSNVAVTGVLRGGNLSSSNTLSITSNTNFSANVNVAANFVVTGITNAVGNTSLYGNSTVGVLLVTGNTSLSEATLNGTNLRINSNVVANGTASFNNTFAVTGNSSLYGNSTVLAFAVTTNSTATNTYIGGTLLTVATPVAISGDVNITGNLTATNITGITIPAGYVNTTGNFSLGGNNTFGGTNTVISSNLFATGSLIQLGSTSANSLTITATGNVGIKNTAPASTLHINGNYTTSQTNIGIVNSTSNGAISLAVGNYFRGTVGGAVSLTFTNFPANSTTGFILAMANVGTNITWPSAVKWASGTTPTFSSNTDIITFITHDAGTTIYGALSIKDAR